MFCFLICSFEQLKANLFIVMVSYSDETPILSLAVIFHPAWAQGQIGAWLQAVSEGGMGGRNPCIACKVMIPFNGLCMAVHFLFPYWNYWLIFNAKNNQKEIKWGLYFFYFMWTCTDNPTVPPSLLHLTCFAHTMETFSPWEEGGTSD